MKKITALLLAVLLLLCSCGYSDGENGASEATRTSNAEGGEVSQEESNAESSEALREESNAESLPEPEPSILYVGGVRVDLGNESDVLGDGKVSAHYNEALARYEIRLDSAYIEARTLGDEALESINGIYSNKDMLITLVGESIINMEIPDIDYFYCFGIRNDSKKVSVNGEGRLVFSAVGAGNCFMASAIDCMSLEIDKSAEVVLNDICEREFLTVTAYEVALKGRSSLEIIAESKSEEVDLPSLFDSVSVRIEDGAELVLRGNEAINARSVYSLSCGEYLYDVYISDDVNGNKCKASEMIYESYSVGKDTRYARITEGKGERLSLWIGEKNVSLDNACDVFGDGSVSYDIETHTLTFDNAVISDKNARESYGIWSSVDLNLVLIGESTIECAKEGVSLTCGIDCKALTVSGEGSLLIKTAKGNGKFGFSAPIRCKEYLQKSGNVTAIAGDADDYKGYTISSGIYVYEKGVTVEKGTLYAESGRAGFSDPIGILYDLRGERVVYPEQAFYEEGTTDNGRRFVKITAE